MSWFIKVRGKDGAIDTYPRTALSYTMVNPAIDPDQIDRAYTFSFKIPTSHRNCEILEWSHRIDRFDIHYTARWEAVLYLEGVPFEYGFLTLKSNTDMEFDVEFEVPGKDIMEKLDKIKLNKLSQWIRIPQPAVQPAWFFGITVGYTYYNATSGLGGFGTGPVYYRMTIRDRRITSPAYTLADWGANKSAYLSDFKNQINTEFGEVIAHVSTLLGNDLLIISDHVIQISEDEIETNELLVKNPGYSGVGTRQYMWSEFASLVNGDAAYDFTYPVIMATESGGEDADGAASYWYNMKIGDLYWWQLPSLRRDNLYVPMVKARWVIEELLSSVGIDSYVGDALNTVDIQEAIIFSNASFGEDETYYGPYGDGQKEYVPLIEFDLGWALPEMSGKEFLTRFCESFGMYFTLIGDSIKFVRKRDQFENTVQDWTGKCEPRWERKSFSTGAQIIRYPEDEHIHHLDQLLPYGEEGEEIVLPFNTLADIEVGEILAEITEIDEWEWQDINHIKVPLWHGSFTSVGKEPSLPKSSDVGDLVLLFWRGLRVSENGDTYGFATSGITDYNDSVVGTLNFDMHGVESIYEKRWKDILQQKSTDVISMSVRLSTHDVVNLRQWEHTVKKITTAQGSFVGLIRSVELSLISDIWSNEVVAIIEFGLVR